MLLRRKRNKFLGMVTLAVAISFSNQAQVPGCTDTLAVNFNSLAETNDGSCQYDPIDIFATTVSDPMSSSVMESSGLLYHDGSLWTINDSGNEPELYELDPSDGTVLKTALITNSTQVDWEALASDGVHFYIGDFGNNLGSRTDLGIYKVPWDPVLESSGDTVVQAELISFSYPDQTDFTPAFQQTEHDCEAMVFYQDSLHVFSKDWANNKTRHYRLPIVPGSYEATLIDSFNVNGVITDAAIRNTDDVIMLLGYSELIEPFMFMLNDFPNGKPLSGNKRKLLLPEHSFHKTEGLAFDDSLSLFFTREFNLTGPGLYHADVTAVLYPNGLEVTYAEAFSINRNEGRLQIYLRSKFNDHGVVRVYDLSGRLLLSEDIPFGVDQISIGDPSQSQMLLIAIEGNDRRTGGVVVPVSGNQ